MSLRLRVDTQLDKKTLIFRSQAPAASPFRTYSDQKWLAMERLKKYLLIEYRRKRQQRVTCVSRFYPGARFQHWRKDFRC